MNSSSRKFHSIESKENLEEADAENSAKNIEDSTEHSRHSEKSDKLSCTQLFLDVFSFNISVARNSCCEFIRE